MISHLYVQDLGVFSNEVHDLDLVEVADLRAASDTICQP
jgi:hypothetical protein